MTDLGLIKKILKKNLFSFFFFFISRIALYRQEGIRRVSPFYSLIGSTRYILLNSIVPVRLFSTSVLKKSFSFLDPYLVTGFSDAESCLIYLSGIKIIVRIRLK